MSKKLLFLVCFGFNSGAIKSVPPKPKFIKHSQKTVKDIRYTSELNFYHWWHKRHRHEIEPILKELNEITGFIRISEESFHKIPQELNERIFSVLNVFHDEIFTAMKKIPMLQWQIEDLRLLQERLDSIDKTTRYWDNEYDTQIICIKALCKKSIKFFDNIISSIESTSNRIHSKQKEEHNTSKEEFSDYQNNFYLFTPDSECP